ncbi:tyrosine-protein phosphatase [Avibacterium sp. 21-599]|uniref:tyrosine-protein phosphatase n=1 Tax=Avibacterium sp. 21-599 TaxID=2911528 RepID=UPI0022450BFC|nr:tyrosine-protein phosphatase [Avibacterium sp. 21-599]MCW9717530.1 tyrosine-protein phosphatase [Avibacterium sp. 21-599]
MQALKTAQNNGRTVLVHCYHGADRTGIVLAMYRIIFENQTVEQARYEMKYGGYGHHPIWVNIDKLLNEKTV